MPHTSSQIFRRALIEAHLIGWMVALLGQLFTHAQIPACIWFLTKNKDKSRTLVALRDALLPAVPAELIQS